MDEIISEKKEREDGSSSCSNSTGMLVWCDQDYPSNKLTLRVLVTQGLLSHICQLDRALA